MELRDSRRLTGPNLLMAGPGAVLDVAHPPGGPSAQALAASWCRHARRILDALGWEGEQVGFRLFDSGLSLAISAPVDALYAATEVNEWAFAQARRELGGQVGDGPQAADLALAADLAQAEDLALAAPRLAQLIADESNPLLRALVGAARERGIACLFDDELVSLGMGCGSRTWPVRDAPNPDELDWTSLHDIPLALVTGTNGKSTSVRMLAAMAGAAGFLVGSTSTDDIRVGEERLEAGDWSGPGGARRLLREREVELAVLETARGGLLRRGLAVEEAAVAVVTNVAADHLGEWGVSGVEELADAKLVVARAGRNLVLNADDPVLAGRAPGLAGSARGPLARFAGRPLTFFGLDPSTPLVRAHLASQGTAALLEGDELVIHEGGRRHVVARVEELPSALGGAARFNLANALAALGAGSALGLPVAAMAEALRRFESSAEANPGRLNLFEIGGARFLVDFAHNPHGLKALFDTSAALKPKRLLVVLGQAGDRDDESIRELARLTAAARPDRVLVKEMERHARGRPAGEVAGILEAELLASGLPRPAIGREADELSAARTALAWSRPGDLLLILSHAQREELIAWLQGLSSGPRAPVE